jgi:hypothetical protein
MPSFKDLFNPTFLMFLGILILVVGLIVVYFETKMRDQNHKIASMLSLVSTLAEDMNGVKIGMNHLAISIAGGTMQQKFQQPLEEHNKIFDLKEENKLIEVSDDEVSDDEVTDDEVSDDEVSDDEVSDDENDEDDYSNHYNDDESILNNDNESNDKIDDNFNKTSNDIKVLKLNINKQIIIEDIDESENLDLDLDLDLDLNNCEAKLSENNYISSKSSNFVEEVLELKINDEKKDNNEKILNISSSDLKTVNIDLEELQTENIDYKKLQLPKLRSIVIEEGLASHSDATKLKKQDILKLLGVE